MQLHEVHTGRFLFGTGISLFSHLLVIYSLKNDAFNHVIIASSSSWLQEHVADISHSLCRIIPGLSVILLPRVNPFSLLAVSGAITCLVTNFLLEYEYVISEILFSTLKTIQVSQYVLCLFSGNVMFVIPWLRSF